MNFKEFKELYQKVPVDNFLSKEITGNPLVSVCVQTYQHANYITECLEGILKQETDFSFEILVGEDNSTDGTREICIDYAKRYPNRIQLFLHRRENNIHIGGKATGRFNFVYNLFSTKGKYVAICEGDDYWTDSKKLQKQVDFLENNQDYVLCSHNGTIVDEIGTGKTGNKLHPEETDFDFHTEDLIVRNRASTLTVVFRNNKISNLPDWFTQFGGCDRSLYIILSQYGKLRHLNFDGAVYRIHNGGVSVGSKVLDKKKRVETMLKKHYSLVDYQMILDLFFNHRYLNLSKKMIRYHYLQIFLIHFSEKEFLKASKTLCYLSSEDFTTFKDKLKYFSIKTMLILRKKVKKFEINLGL